MTKKTKRNLKLPEPNYPPDHPDAIARMAEAMPWKTDTARNFGVGDYIDAILKLRAREYSFADIAKWLTEHLAEKLGRKKITRGQVYRVYREWEYQQDPLVETLTGPPDISEEEAEAGAAQLDRKSKPTEEKSP
jgi:hypothetical protein